jgi:uncharacterized protein YeaC (DUF1315 family)
MDYQQLIETMTPQIYESLKRSLELGRWPDGKALTPRQRDDAMQAVIAWGEQHLAPIQRVGFIDKKHKAGDTCDDPVETTLNWKE